MADIFPCSQSLCCFLSWYCFRILWEYELIFTPFSFSPALLGPLIRHYPGLHEALYLALKWWNKLHFYFYMESSIPIELGVVKELQMWLSKTIRVGRECIWRGHKRKLYFKTFFFFFFLKYDIEAFQTYYVSELFQDWERIKLKSQN